MAQFKNNPKKWSDICQVWSSNPHLLNIRPWLKPLFQNLKTWPDVETLDAVAKELRPDFKWQFVKQEPVPRRAKSKGLASLTGYLQLVLDEQKIPIRESSLHDLLNALTFIMFPASKTALAQRHRHEAPFGIKPGQNRTRTQDLLTIFDEGGVVCLKTGKMEVRDLIFGHAVYEHITNGVGLRAAKLDLTVDDEIISKPIQEVTEIADRLLAQWLSNPDQCVSPDEFTSLVIT